MGAYHARKLRPMATVNPEVIRGRVATVKLSRRRYLKKRPRIAGFCTLCVPHHTQGSCWGDRNSALAAVHERNKQEKSLPKKAAQTGRQTHPKQQRGQFQTLRPAGTRRPRLGQRKVWSPHVSPISSASLFAVGIHSEVLMPRVDDHRVQPRCQYFSYEVHPRD